MPRKLPTPTALYVPEHTRDILLLRDSKEFSVCTRFFDPAFGPNSYVVRAVRTSTQEDPKNKTKRVLFAVAPDTVLLNGRVLYAHPRFADVRIFAEWSDFLKLVRWTKLVKDLPENEQARIAYVVPSPGHESGYEYQLVADEKPTANPVILTSEDEVPK